MEVVRREQRAGVRPGDVVVIPAGTRQRLWSIGRDPLLVLCCSAPPYSHEDTVLCE